MDGSLAEALSSGNEEGVVGLARLLLAVDRFATIGQLYVSSRLQKMHGVWEELQVHTGTAACLI